MSTYCITSQRSVGCTFFDWTIHFLSGQEQFYRINSCQWIPLTTDPVLTVNAHGHPKNHPSGFADTRDYINKVLAKSQDYLYSMYPFILSPYRSAVDLGIAIDKIGDPKNQQLIEQYQQNDFDQVFAFCNQLNVKLIYIGDDSSMQLYYAASRSNGLSITNGKPHETLQCQKDEFQQVFFNDSVDTWNKLKLTNTWDQRERQALDSRPFKYQDMKFNGMQHPHLWINCHELWHNGEQVALKMLEFLELTVLPERLAAWKSIYAKWQKKQLHILKFNYNYQHIVDSIVNNWYYEIDLTFEQEVIIQHCLIYQHNLNLKTWELEKFPNNTQDLYKLLEPNIHPVVPY